MSNTAEAVAGTAGFNGAGMFPSRKLVSAMGPHGHPRSFNGAGMFPSRKSLGAGSYHNRVVTLQWGRNVSIPEIRLRVTMILNSFGLQWGRNVSIPEMFLAMEYHQPFHRLQWGRNVSIPEIRYPGFRLQPSSLLQWGRNVSIPEIYQMAENFFGSPSFNGAGMFPSRKSSISRIICVPRSGFNGAGMFPSRKCERAGGGDRRGGA